LPLTCLQGGGSKICDILWGQRYVTVFAAGGQNGAVVSVLDGPIRPNEDVVLDLVCDDTSPGC